MFSRWAKCEQTKQEISENWVITYVVYWETSKISPGKLAIADEYKTTFRRVFELLDE